MTGKLSIVGTPLGNLEDITLRALRVLGEVDLILAEDTRHTQKLLNHYEIKARLRSLHAHNEGRTADAIVEELRSGKHYALVSDAGMPLISDPGASLIPRVIEAGLALEVIPGPSALTTAIALSGLRSDGLRFLGFLPRSGSRRKTALAEIANEYLTSVFFESPHRVQKTIEELGAFIEEDRQVVIAREMTKRFEEVIRGTVSEVSAALAGGVRGEITVIVEGSKVRRKTRYEEDDQSAPGALGEASGGETSLELHRFIEEARARGEHPRALSKRLAQKLGISGREAYRLIQEARRENEPPDQAGS